MFTNLSAIYYGNDKILIEAACLHADSKPTTGIANGSLCLEIDTGDIYAFNEAGSAWVKLGA